MPKSADLEFGDHGTLVLAHPVSERGQSWLAEHCPVGDDHTYYGAAIDWPGLGLPHCVPPR